MFDRELFEKLCDRYGVSFSADYSKLMLRDGDTIRPITKSKEGDIKIFNQKLAQSLKQCYFPDMSIEYKDCPCEICPVGADASKCLEVHNGSRRLVGYLVEQLLEAGVLFNGDEHEGEGTESDRAVSEEAGVCGEIQ